MAQSAKIRRQRGITVDRSRPAAYADSPAPAGARWEFVKHQGRRVTHKREPVVALVRN